MIRQPRTSLAPHFAGFFSSVAEPYLHTPTLVTGSKTAAETAGSEKMAFFRCQSSLHEASSVVAFTVWIICLHTPMVTLEWLMSMDCQN